MTFKITRNVKRSTCWISREIYKSGALWCSEANLWCKKPNCLQIRMRWVLHLLNWLRPAAHTLRVFKFWNMTDQWHAESLYGPWRDNVQSLLRPSPVASSPVFVHILKIFVWLAASSFISDTFGPNEFFPRRHCPRYRTLPRPDSLSSFDIRHVQCT